MFETGATKYPPRGKSAITNMRYNQAKQPRVRREFRSIRYSRRLILARVIGGRRNQIVSLATRHTIPTVYGLREFAAAGGLISYGASFPASFRQAGIYAGRILKGR